MSGQQTSTTNQTQTQTANPVAQAALAPFGQIGLNVAQTPYSHSMDPQVAALNSQQQTAISGLGGLQSANPASPYISQANQYSQEAANPNNVTAMAQQFYNPMSQQVLNQLSGVFGQQNAQLLGNAAASGAIGGSRYGVAAGNLANQQGLAAGQTLAGLQQQALNAAQTEQGQISQQAFTQGQLGNEALNTQIQGINAALQGGFITQQQAQNQLNAIQTAAIQKTLFPQQEAAAGENIALGTTALGGTTTGQGTTSTPVNYANMIGGIASLGAGLMSDERTKENIEPIGKSFDKQTIYKFNYIGDPTTRIGLMAQEVQKKHPDAVEKGPGGFKTVDYNKALPLHRADGGETLAEDIAQSSKVNVPQVHYPTLDLNPQKQGSSGQQQSSGGGLPGMGGLGSLGSSMSGGLSGLADSAGSALGAVGSGIGDAAGAIGAGIGDAAGAIGSALGGMSFADFLPALAFLADGGSVRKHRAIGGGTGIGNGVSGLEGYSGVPSASSSGLNFSGVQSPLSAYFARSPQVNIPHVNLPTLNLGSGGQNNAQQQPFSDPKQMQALGQSLGTMGNAADTYLNADFGGGGADFAHGGRIHRQSGGPVASGFPQSIADAIQKHPDATSIKQNPGGGHNVQLQNGIGIKYPGQKQAPNGDAVKHRDIGGPVDAPWNFQSDSPSQDLIRAREQPMVFPTSAPLIPEPEQYKTASAPSFLANAPAIPPAGDQAPQDVTAPSGLMADYLEHRRDPSYRPGWPTQIASINPIQGLPGDEGIPKLPDRLQPDNTTQQPTQQAAIASPAQTPPPVTQPKPAQQPRNNQQPQFGTPEWRNWADSYGRVSIQGETGRSSAFQGLGEINTHDTNGTHSYGNYGLNSGGSAQEFVRQYGLDGIGLTAQPGTAMFDMQWREAARNPASADILRRAEIDYYNKHYVNPTVSGMSQYLPVNIANSRAAQEYMIDKSVQQGTGTWDGNSGIGIKHIRRAQQAAEESGGDPVKFVQRMAQLDHAAVGSDFPAALHSGAYSPLGDLNRLKTRVQGALGELGEGIQVIPGQIGSGIRGMLGGESKPQSVLDRPDLQPPKPGESELDRRMAEFGFQPNQLQGLGGSLGRALGMNPSLSQQNSNRLVNLGLGMLAAGPSVGVKGFPGAMISLGQGIGKGGQFALQQEQNERNQAIALANAATNQKLKDVEMAKWQWEMQKPQHAGTAVSYDLNGMPKYNPIFQRYSPEKGWEWIQGPEGSVGPSGNPIDSNVVGPNAYDSPIATRKAISEAQAKDLHGEEFLGTLAPSPRDDTRAILAGQRPLPPESNRTPSAMLRREAVLQADPNYNDEWLKYQQSWTDPKSKVGIARVAQKTAISHMYDAVKSGALDQIPDHKGDLTSRAHNEAVIWAAKQKNAPWLKNLETHNDVIATEVAKIAAAASNGSALADRDNNRGFLELAQGKESLLGVYKSMVNLMAGRGQDGLEADWKQNASPWAKPPKILSDEDQKKVAFIEQKLAEAEAKAGGKAQAKATQQQQAAPKPTEPPPAPNATKAPDGNWYIPDPDRPGKYLKVNP